jgi:hypothetical protein
MRLLIVLIAGTLLLSSLEICFGQEARAVILGRVADASGAGIVWHDQRGEGAWPATIHLRTQGAILKIAALFTRG